MPRLLIHVEGQTEEAFVNHVLAPHLYRCGYTSVRARLLGNSRQRSKRGGARAWTAARGDIVRHLKEDQGAISTTMVDFYGLPRAGLNAWPGRAEAGGLPFAEKAGTVQEQMLEAIRAELGGDPAGDRFVPYVVMHEFEGLLFSDPVRFGEAIGRSDLAPQFQAIRDGFTTPEEINDSQITAPSKRVEALVPGYQKPFMGVLAAEAIGLDVLRGECPRFSRWIQQLEGLAE